MDEGLSKKSGSPIFFTTFEAVIVGSLKISKVILSTPVSSPSIIPVDGSYVYPPSTHVPVTVKVY